MTVQCCERCRKICDAIWGIIKLAMIIAPSFALGWLNGNDPYSPPLVCDCSRVVEDNASSLAACEEELQQYYETGKPPYPCKITNTCK